MKVYVVMQGEYEGKHIVAVTLDEYSSKQLAYAYSDNADECYIEEYELSDSTMIQGQEYIFKRELIYNERIKAICILNECECRCCGKHTNATDLTPELLASTSKYALYKKSERSSVVFASNYGHRSYIIRVVANNEYEAKKVLDFEMNALIEELGLIM